MQSFCKAPQLKTIEVEVVLALPVSQALHKVAVCLGSTALQAVEQSGLASPINHSDNQLTLACFGRLIPLDYLVSEGDRVEILRPLVADPKDQRHARVKAAKRQSARASKRLGVV